MAGEQSTLAQLIWPKIEFASSDECWPWAGARNGDDYGVTKIGGRSGQIIRAHRAVFVLWHGITLEDIEGIEIRHTCDNPPCCNPRHLITGSHLDNMEDMRLRGRSAGGARSGHAKLTWEEVREIRELHRLGIHTQAELARRHGMSQSTLSSLLRGKTWKEPAHG